MEEYRYLQELTERYPALKGLEEEIRAAFLVIKESFEAGGKLLVAGNRGSCADSEQIVGELMKSFVKPRPLPEALKEALIHEEPGLGGALSEKLQGGLPAIALNSHPGLTSAFLNDVDGEMAYAQQVLGYGKKGDVFLGITTSGNAKNIRYAAVTARAMGLRVVGLTGRGGGALAALCDAAVIAPEKETYRIQELHLPIYHALCLMLEETFF